MKTAFLVVAGFLLAQVLYAKRIAAKPVSPVVSNGVEYSAEGGGQVQYVVATDMGSSRQLWKVEIFRTHIKPWLEPDVQLVFITDLALRGGTLLIRDEKARCYELKLATKKVKKRACE
jgi:hypothetical protein